MALQVHWVKCGQPPTWCPFETVDLSNVTDEGVYVIWHGAPNPWTVRVGLGVIKARLEAHRKDPTILAYRQHGGLYVTWAVIEREQQEGVENNLADLLKPLVGEPLSQRLTDHGQNSGEHGCGFGRSQLYSDEAPPIGSIGIESWTGVAFPVIVWLLRWN
jgi:hypothetical protein